MYSAGVDWSASAFDCFHGFGGFAGSNALSNHMDVIPYTSPFGNGLSRRYLNDISHLRFEVVLASRRYPHLPQPQIRRAVDPSGKFNPN